MKMIQCFSFFETGFLWADNLELTMIEPSKESNKHRLLKVGRVFLMVIWPEIRMWQHKDDDHREDALQFTIVFKMIPKFF